MKVIIAGSRTFTDYALLKQVCDATLIKQKDIEIVSGKARHGADTLGEQYAIEKGYPIKDFPAIWHKHGKHAGPIRNTEMAKYADGLIAFHDGKSPGTAHMIKIAKKLGLRVKVVKFDPTEIKKQPQS